MILRNGEPFNVSLSFEISGTVFPPNWYYFAPLEEKEKLGFTEVPDPIPPDPRYYMVNTDGTIIQKPIEWCQEVTRIELANIRWAQESAGIIYNNILYTTDPTSKLNYLGAMQRSLLDPTYVVEWKARTVNDPGSAIFVSLSADDMINITNFAITYITQCFVKENELVQQINTTTTLHELTSIDLNSNWPSQYYS